MLFGFLALIALAGYVGGFGPARLGTLLASLVRFYFTLPRESFSVASPADRGRLLILMGTGALIALRQRSREAGFDAHLTKPVDLTRLLALLAPQ